MENIYFFVTHYTLMVSMIKCDLQTGHQSRASYMMDGWFWPMTLWVRRQFRTGKRWNGKEAKKKNSHRLKTSRKRVHFHISVYFGFISTKPEFMVSLCSVWTNLIDDKTHQFTLIKDRKLKSKSFVFSCLVTPMLKVHSQIITPGGLRVATVKGDGRDTGDDNRTITQEA